MKGTKRGVGRMLFLEGVLAFGMFISMFFEVIYKGPELDWISW
jgi:hypothetical protein